MNDFKENVEQQKRIDKQIYAHAVSGIRSTVDASCREKSKRNVWEGKTEYLAGQVLDYFKIQRIDVPDEIPQEERLEYIFDSVHILKRVVRLEGRWWKRESFPLLVKDRETGTYEVLLPGTYGGYRWIDEHSGVEKRVTQTQSEKYESEAFCLYPPFRKANFRIRDFLLEIWRPYGVYDWMVLVLLALAVALLGMVLPFVNQFIFDTIIPSGTSKDIAPVMALLFGVVITTGLFRLVRTIWIIRTSDKGRIWLEAGVWNRMFRLPVKFFHRYEAGDLSNRILLIGEICETIQRGLFPVFLTLLFSVVYLFQINMLSGELLVPSCGILFFLILVTLGNTYAGMKINRKENDTKAKLSGFLFQVYSGIRKIKLCGAENRVFSKWADIYKEHGDSQFHKPAIAKYHGALRNLITVGGTLVIYLTVYRNEINASAYISYEVAFGSLLAAILQLGMIADSFAFLIPALKMVEPVLQEREESETGRTKVNKLGGEIELSNVSFRYSPEMDYVLHELNISIKSGEYVAIVGPSGCGKSTLFRLLLGFETPEKGAVYYDGKDLSMLDMPSLRKRIGTVLQDGKLFEGDMFANISLCVPELTMDEAWNAAKAAGLAEDIEAMPMGMFTMVSDGAGSLSGGQKQRVLIARVMAMHPDILLFDEATSALDNITQSRVVKSIGEMKATRIVIAHRLSTIKNCDRILYLENGKVAEDGSYEELMKLDGGFAALAKRQLA